LTGNARQNTPTSSLKCVTSVIQLIKCSKYKLVGLQTRGEQANILGVGFLFILIAPNLRTPVRCRVLTGIIQAADLQQTSPERETDQPKMSLLNYILIGLAAVAAGAVNALAGGGTLITFPMLIAVGVPAVAANVTNTVALVPGYLGATIAQLEDIKDQRRRLWLYLPVGVIGGFLGGVLLLNTGEKLFRDLVPFLILLASGLLAIQEPLRAWLKRRASQQKRGGSGDAGAILPLGLAAVYGGYFGAGLSVIILAVLGLAVDDSLTRLNALKQAIAFAVNIAAAVLFVFSGKVVWSAALVMAVGALIGGALGGRLAGRIQPSTLRRVVVIIGVTVSIIYFIR
jgi:uncharacterized membrane protein YfcA